MKHKLARVFPRLAKTVKKLRARWQGYKKTISAKILLGFTVLIFVVMVTQTLILNYTLEYAFIDKKVHDLRAEMARIDEEMDGYYTEIGLSQYLSKEALTLGGVILIYTPGDNVFYSYPHNYGDVFVTPEDFWSKHQDTEQRFLQTQVKESEEEGLEWLICSYLMDDDRWLIIEIPTESLQVYSGMMRFFNVYILLSVVAIGPVLSIWISRKIAKPVVELNHIATEIQNLNFNIRYKGTEKDEIGSLGRTFNVMNERLSASMTLLKQELAKEKQLKDLRRQFTAQVSHELKTPISIIKGYAEALGDDIPDTPEEKAYYLNVIHEETEKMDKLIMGLLELSKLQTGNYPIEIIVIDYVPFVSDILQKYEKLFQENDMAVSFSYPEETVYVEGDGLKLEQVITNLLNNAMVHALGGRTLKITVDILDDEVRTTIYNEGKHIPEEDIPYLFESFYKRKNSPGSGLGLSIVEGLLALHQSQPTISNQDQGVAVTFSLSRYDLDRARKTEGDYIDV